MRLNETSKINPSNQRLRAREITDGLDLKEAAESTQQPWLNRIQQHWATTSCSLRLRPTTAPFCSLLCASLTCGIKAARLPSRDRCGIDDIKYLPICVATLN